MINVDDKIIPAGQFVYIVDQVGSTYAFEDIEFAIAFFITENAGGSMNLQMFKTKAPRNITLHDMADYACSHGQTIEDE